MKPRMRDAALSVAHILPVGAAVVVSASLDCGPLTTQGGFVPNAEAEFLLEAPALSTAQLPDGTTITYDFIASANADLSSSVVLHKSALIQTGAGGVGAIAAEATFRPAVAENHRYFGWQATGVATVAASGATATMTYVV
jgi:hypothetical protein